MGTNQQRRAAAKRKVERQNERRAKQAAARRRNLSVIGIVAAVLVVVGGVWLIMSLVDGGNSGSGDEAAGQSASRTDAGAARANAGASGSADAATAGSDAEETGGAPTAPGSDAEETGDNSLCSYPVSGSAAKDVAPPTDLNPPTEGTVTADVVLGSGSLTFSLERSGAPCAVNSFASLAHQGYFDDTPCHRLTDSPSLKVLQCGDPTGTGTGGPGYSFADELSGNETYDRGTIAMANAGPDTNGSQFFLVYGDSRLPASYDVLGTISGGMDVLDAIADAGIDGGGQDGSPADPVTIESISIDT